MPIYEFSIAVIDEPEYYRKNEGDIISILSYGAEWGSAIVDEYLIVLIDITGKTLDAVRQFFLKPLLSDGHVEGETFVEQPDPSNPLIEAIDLKTDQPISMPSTLAKNRYTISLATVKYFIPELDYAKVRDKKVKYQPFKIATQLTEKSEILNANDVDCGLDNTKELSIKWKSANLIKDKFTNTFILPKDVMIR